ncbi:MAG: pirin family protein, partial [Jiangellaceae bacterium]
MSNLETQPRELTCDSHDAVTDPAALVEILTPREVPLGGPRAMTVRRTLPQRQRSLIGAWCFLDHYGPDSVSETGGMVVPPHPHTGLQTVSWLLTGEIEHRDSAGYHAMVRPGELNIMTAGRGISHSEVSTPGTTILHGVQLWLALPSAARFSDPGFEHFVPAPVTGDGYEARVFLGSLLDSQSPVRTHSPLLGAEISLDAGTALDLTVDERFEHGLLVDSGSLVFNGTTVQPGELAYLPPGQSTIALSAPEGGPARVV